MLASVAACGLSACANGGTWLNSDRIEMTFGNYGVDLVKTEPGRRVSSLYSTHGDNGKITRTFAVVEFTGEPREAFAREHSLVESGQSLGATFRNAGWSIDKQHIFIGELEVPPTYASIAALMRIDLPETLATHVYLLIIGKNEQTFNYATITEIHHPDYLSAENLKAIYGEILFDDSNRNSLHDFIGPPDATK